MYMSPRLFCTSVRLVHILVRIARRLPLPSAADASKNPSTGPTLCKNASLMTNSRAGAARRRTNMGTVPYKPGPLCMIPPSAKIVVAVM